ncbi:hypothetical protein K3152_10385 [Qipengyuania sp. 1NDH17]|uniref:Lasso RiPP family leader peptide-containing protein n=1 Tax=Qipengyuania polymorpha TaxID=2867234 RepID=A0ABS7J1N0_9SPHN|nr:hypothetical protein [Qipengyuania polymorpha]MBX7458652.1 hypothetical protein [Qipengyuania polymorpha]
MTKHEQDEAGSKPRWETPELVKLGTMRDIAQGWTPNDQANNNKRS